MSAGAMLEVRDLTTTFQFGGRAVRALDHVSFDVRPGEVLGLVGESGSGKSVTLRSILGLIHAPGRVAGSVLWQGRNLVEVPPRQLRRVRGAEIAMIFQEPMTALNPVLTVGMQIGENLRAHTDLDASARRARALELLDLVGIPDARRRLADYPHQFSGGMRQRVMIAIAIASNPRLLLADEPTTALDVTIQDQILKLLLNLRDELGMSIVLVTHDLGVVAASCDRVVVMYAGRIAETAPVIDLFEAPRHAYTRGLLASVPLAGAERAPLRTIEGTPPSLMALPPGCAFAPRCVFGTEICHRSPPPELVAVGADRVSACLHHDRLAADARLPA